ncbi:stage V sporulation protein AD [Alkalithermobacter thermoalcaliphilus JW-YL-7 = DSM 7308]|uniref:Stage V sporulation protein AD n=1 Tax=Alkalithermobacter thermoalcaliphilus JW-YL-7 = DSM 7308 TaxID=1121328 RepID=A0A150FQR4_CLOPD|nr:stage V sporulation protein AD [[Clostridium] paradoxum JW-YL-7 = DSM 7308]SHK53537.1 stage V sporulation protein AD [[Clostridium] paradoxum JW-YL-7 = DSM 7308]
MANKRLGSQTVQLQNDVVIISTASIVGPKEGKGPLSEYFDKILQDDLFGEKSWELAESKMIKEAMKMAIAKTSYMMNDVDYIFSGDLLNQLMSTSFAVRDLKRPFFGLYGACSTMSESLSLASMIVDGGYSDLVLAGTSSHFSSAERQFRFPLEMGYQRPLTAQWTVTGAGCTVLSSKGEGPKVKRITTGKVIDKGIKDPNNMGAAMAPAAVDTIKTYFDDTKDDIDSFDIIATGDLGKLGMDIALDLIKKEGYDISKVYTDCGVEIFDHEKQDTHCGGSGCGCSAVTFCGYIYNKLINKEFNKIMLVSTGALLSPTSTLQKQSIPSVAHAVVIQNY